jgi:hypothetical protein
MDDELECVECGSTITAETLDDLLDELEESQYYEG